MDVFTRLHKPNMDKSTFLKDKKILTQNSKAIFYVLLPRFSELGLDCWGLSGPDVGVPSVEGGLVNPDKLAKLSERTFRGNPDEIPSPIQRFPNASTLDLVEGWLTPFSWINLDACGGVMKSCEIFGTERVFLMKFPTEREEFEIPCCWTCSVFLGRVFICSSRRWTDCRIRSKFSIESTAEMERMYSSGTEDETQLVFKKKLKAKWKCNVTNIRLSVRNC
jgi:hypothetical protein